MAFNSLPLIIIQHKVTLINYYLYAIASTERHLGGLEGHGASCVGEGRSVRNPDPKTRTDPRCATAWRSRTSSARCTPRTGSQREP